MAFNFAPQNATATGAAAILTVTLPAVASNYTYCSGVAITGLGATAASGFNATLSGVNGGPLNFAVAVPAGATVGVAPVVVRFNPPLQSSAVNTAIVLTVPSFGAGNTLASATATGYTEE